VPGPALFPLRSGRPSNPRPRPRSRGAPRAAAPTPRWPRPRPLPAPSSRGAGLLLCAPCSAPPEPEREAGGHGLAPGVAGRGPAGGSEEEEDLLRVPRDEGAAGRLRDGARCGPRGRGAPPPPPPPPPPSPPGREPLPPLAPAPAGPEPRVTARIEPPRRALLGRRRGGVPRGHGVRTRGEAREVLTRSRAGGVRAGPEARECQELIEKHKECLRAEGFNV